MNSVIKRPRHRRNPFFFHPFENLLSEMMNDVENIKPAFSPASNVIETDDAFKLDLAIPGYSKKEINIEVDNNILRISAEREATKEEDSTYRLREFNYGSFKRAFTLPDNTVAEEIKASFKNGVLTIEIPKVPVQEARKITIK